ncbi:MAG: HD domain-containing protein [Candidatus Thorarchaeota archaeon]
MKPDDVISLFIKSEILKSLQRTGWATAGVRGPVIESVADHSYGTTFISLVLAKMLRAEGEGVDLEKTLTMAVLHDLGESVVSDVPSSSDSSDARTFANAKTALEAKAVASILSPLGDLGFSLQSCWTELHEGISTEARIVGSADLLDMLVHAVILERSGVAPRILQGFFDSGRRRLKELGIKLAIDLYSLLEAEHGE